MIIYPLPLPPKPKPKTTCRGCGMPCTLLCSKDHRGKKTAVTASLHVFCKHGGLVLICCNVISCSSADTTCYQAAIGIGSAGLQPASVCCRPTIQFAPLHFVPQRGGAPSLQPSPSMEREHRTEKMDSRLRGNDDRIHSAGACPSRCTQRGPLHSNFEQDQSTR